MPSASETMAMAVTKGVLKSVRMANLTLRIKTLDDSRYCGVYRRDCAIIDMWYISRHEEPWRSALKTLKPTAWPGR